jgi:hypothetical protein
MRWESARKDEIEQREARRRHLELRCLQVQLERAEDIIKYEQALIAKQKKIARMIRMHQ